MAACDIGAALPRVTPHATARIRHTYNGTSNTLRTTFAHAPRVSCYRARTTPHMAWTPLPSCGTHYASAAGVIGEKYGGASAASRVAQESAARRGMGGGAYRRRVLATNAASGWQADQRARRVLPRQQTNAWRSAGAAHQHSKPPASDADKRAARRALRLRLALRYGCIWLLLV